jgi:hypothetical protein
VRREREFHGFAFDRPMFSREIVFAVGETVERAEVAFTNLLPVRK